MTLKNLAMIFGVTFLAAGILGFVPGVTNDQDLLLGILKVDGLHNVVHILTGVAALLVASNARNALLYFRVFGVVYALVTILGFIQGDTVLGIITVNTNDNIFHTLVTAAYLYIGFGLKDHHAVEA